MTTCMRNGRDRRSGNPLSATRAKSACFCSGPISGSHQGQQPNGCTQRPDTWLHPNVSLRGQILFPARQAQDIEEAARAIGQRIVLANANTDEELDDAFASLIREGIGALS